MNTSFKTAADFRKSLESRLKNIASSTGRPLQRLRKQVAFDRLLARLLSGARPRFFLKGGYAMELRIAQARATKDIDLTSLHRISNEDSSIDTVITNELRELAKQDLGDFFSYEIENSIADLDGAPYGGARHPVTSLIDGRLFVRFQLDVGADAIVTHTGTIEGEDWLGYCGITRPIFPAISIEQQWAEKLHAYTAPRQNRANTRVKDLVDMVLIAQLDSFNKILRDAILKVFRVRGSHPVPEKLPPPLENWAAPYLRLAAECSLSLNLSDAFSEVASVFHSTFQ